MDIPSYPRLGTDSLQARGPSQGLILPLHKSIPSVKDFAKCFTGIGLYVATRWTVAAHTARPLSNNMRLAIRETTNSGKTRCMPPNAAALSVLRDWQARTSKDGLVFEDNTLTGAGLMSTGGFLGRAESRGRPA